MKTKGSKNHPHQIPCHMRMKNHKGTKRKKNTKINKTTRRKDGIFKKIYMKIIYVQQSATHGKMWDLYLVISYT